LYADLPATQKLVMLVLADHADENGEGIYPSVHRVAALAGMSRRTVQRMLSDLVEDQWIRVVASSSRHRPTEYAINVEYVEDHAIRGDKLAPQGRQPRQVEVTTDASKGRQGDTQTYKTTDQEQVTNLRERDPIWDALVATMGVPSPPVGEKAAPKGKSERGKWNAAAKELREMGVTADEIVQRAVLYRIKWPEIDLNPRALVNNWDAVAIVLPGPRETRMAQLAMARDNEADTAIELQGLTDDERLGD
jgi:hypothetical protein